METLKNVLFADCTAAKTTWIWLDASGKQRAIESSCINPFIHTEKEIERSLQQVDIPEEEVDSIQEVYFFGMGCYCPDRREQLSNVLTKKFGNAFVSIESDILGLAYGLLGSKSGYIVLLDTSSNMCYYNGENIEGLQSSIGYILGEEASWLQVCKKLLADFFYGNLPKDLEEMFRDEYHLTKDIALKSIYKKYNPQSYIVSFAPFVIQHREHIYFQNSVSKILEDFFDAMFQRHDMGKIKEEGVIFGGSLAKTFENCIYKLTKKLQIDHIKVFDKDAYATVQHIAYLNNIL